ncbi:hypothetical protein [Marinimicrobium sp. C2-29]|uniref:hypothetical protein n=1 Tax=Marinimicrobium sp. C2-29 TaxID=3139825 RepID=UPI0031395BE0
MNASLKTVGTRVSYHNTVGRILASTEEHIVIDFDSYSEPKIIDISTAERALGKTLMLMKPGIIESRFRDVMTVKEEIDVARKSQYVKELEKVSGKRKVGGSKIRKRAIMRCAKALNDSNPPSPATLARWARDEYDHSLGVARSCLTARKRRFPSYPELRDAAMECIDEHYLTTSLPTYQYVFDIFVVKMKKDGYEVNSLPCYQTFINWIDEIDPFEQSLKRLGRKATRATRRNAVKKLKTERPLERVESDALSLAIGLVDDDGLFLGYVTLFFVLDCHTRSILGYQMNIGRGEPSSCVIDAYRHALCPKPVGTFSKECESDWPMYGAIECAVSDGGKGYSSVETQSFLKVAGSSSEILATYSGWEKPYIERFNGTVRTQFAQNLPGYCGRDPRKIADATIREQAVMTPAQFKAKLERWIVDEYHHTEHSGINYKAPYQAWTEFYQESGDSPMVPANLEAIQLPFSEELWRKISGDVCHQGIAIGNVRYNDSEGHLKRIGLKLRSRGEPAFVKASRSIMDISVVKIVDPFTDERHLIPANDSAIEPGMSLAEFEAKRVKGYKNKGHHHVRVLADDDDIKELRLKHSAKVRKHRERKAITATPDDLTRSVQETEVSFISQCKGDDESPSTSRTTSVLDDIDFDSLEGYQDED